jgi:hypothetical protein
MICSELINPQRSTGTADLRRYRRLHTDGQQLIRGWFDRAWDMRDCKAEDSFEPFIFAWIALNGWAACITERDADREWRDALTSSQVVCDEFAQVVAEHGSGAAGHAREFHQFWPIFKAQEVRRARLSCKGNRQEVIAYYLNAGICKFEPQCWTRHHDAGEEIPLDWPHTLAALYRVRCNLFHGEKARHSEMDQDIVATALRTLVHFFHEARYLT